MQQTAYSRMMYERQRRKMSGKSVHQSQTLIGVMKNCSKTLVTFMFTQIGVGALLVVYNVIGALAFQSLEGQHGNSTVEEEAGTVQNNTVDALWSLTLKLNILDEHTWRNKAHSAIENYEKTLIPLIRDKGYRVLYPKERWTFSASMMYCLSIYTTIGYGFLTPRTVWGKIATICYAIMGMPLMLLYMSNVGEVLARTFKFIYFRVCHCGNDSLIIQKFRMSESTNNKTTKSGIKMDVNPPERKRTTNNIPKESIPIIWCLCVIGIYVFVGGLTFAHAEGWTALDGCYFCYISLSTIGYGDIVPGGFVVNPGRDSESLETQQIFLSVYLLIGMALVAMCFNLMQEEALQNLKAFWRGVGCMRKNKIRSFRNRSNFVQDSDEWQFFQLQPIPITNQQESKDIQILPQSPQK